MFKVCRSIGYTRSNGKQITVVSHYTIFKVVLLRCHVLTVFSGYPSKQFTPQTLRTYNLIPPKYLGRFGMAEVSWILSALTPFSALQTYISRLNLTNF